ncbi:hypothetical protein BH18ACT2_BH18ACT2_08050 [soil metagenome]
MTRGQLGALRPLVESADAGGYTLPAELVDAWRTFEQVKALPLSPPAPAYFEELAAGVVAAVAGGKTPDVVKAGRELHRAGDGVQAYAAGQRILAEAIEQAGTAAANVAADCADAIIGESLAPVLADIYENARGCGETLGGYDLDPKRLLGADRAVQDAYRELERLVARQSLIWEARKWANAVGFRRPEHDGGGMFLHFERPGEIPGWSHAAGRWPGLDKLAPVEPLARLLWLVAPEVAAAKPWLPTCAQQDERWLVEHADILEQQRAGVALAEHVGARGPMFIR